MCVRVLLCDFVDVFCLRYLETMPGRFPLPPRTNFRSENHSVPLDTEVFFYSSYSFGQMDMSDDEADDVDDADEKTLDDNISLDVRFKSESFNFLKHRNNKLMES